MKCHSTPSLADPLTQMLQSHLAGSVSRLVQKLARRLSQDAQELKTANEKIARMEARIKFLEEKLGGDNKFSGEKTTPDLPATGPGNMDKPGDVGQGDSSLPEPDGVTDNGVEDYEMIDLTAHDDDVSPLPVVVAGGGEGPGDGVSHPDATQSDAWDRDIVVNRTIEKFKRVNQDKRISLVLKCHECGGDFGLHTAPDTYGLHLVECLWERRREKVLGLVPWLLSSIIESNGRYSCGMNDVKECKDRRESKNNVAVHRLQEHMGFEQAIVGNNIHQGDRALLIFHASVLGCEDQMNRTKSRNHYPECHLEAIF